MANSFNLWHVDDKHFVIEAYRIVFIGGGLANPGIFLERSEAEDQAVEFLLEESGYDCSVLPSLIYINRHGEKFPARVALRKEVEALYAAGKFVNMTTKDQDDA